MASSLLVCPIGSKRAVSFAASELAAYLQRMTGRTVLVRPRDSFDHTEKTAIWLGLAAHFPHIQVPDVPDHKFDDSYTVNVTRGAGIITGVNERSVLLGTYRLLREAGCRWVRPGHDGEYIPKCDLSRLSDCVSEAPSYRHRCVSLDGAAGWEHIADMIDWLPKNGYNAYLIPHWDAYTYLQRWYRHTHNPKMHDDPFSDDRAREITLMAVDELKKRGLLYHAVGHGWTSAPFGFFGVDSDPRAEAAPREVQPYLALVNGKRDWFSGGPLSTNLCYSDKHAQSLMADEVVGYAESHPEVDVLHFWLADGMNSNCECEECENTRPSDFYVQMLNAVDARMTERRLCTRLAFSVYGDTLWPPERQELNHSDRFILTFSPGTRGWRHPFPDDHEIDDLPPYTRNRLRLPKSEGEYLDFLAAWKQSFHGDIVDYDYHFIYAHFSDPGYMGVSELAREDCRRLAGLGMSGFISCQTQRTALPTGLGPYLVGMTLWNRKLDPSQAIDDYFTAAFGPEGNLCRDYLAKLTNSFAYTQSSESQLRAVNLLSDIQRTIDDFEPVIQRNLFSGNPCWDASWRYLLGHGTIWRELSRAFDARVAGDEEMAYRRWLAVAESAREQEPALHKVFDVWNFVDWFATYVFSKPAGMLDSRKFIRVIGGDQTSSLERRVQIR